MVYMLNSFKLLLGVFAIALVAQTAQAGLKEYKVIAVHKFQDRAEVELVLNQFAALGWVVKAVVPRIINGTNSYSDIYLERDDPEGVISD